MPWVQIYESGWFIYLFIYFTDMEIEWSGPAQVVMKLAGPRNIICKTPSSTLLVLSLLPRWGDRYKLWLYLAESASSTAASRGSRQALKQKADRKALHMTILWKVEERLDTRQPKISHKIHKRSGHKHIMYDLSNAGSDHSWPDLASTCWIVLYLFYQIIWFCTDMT